MEKFVYTLIMVMGLSTTVAFADDKVVEDIDWALSLTYTPVGVDKLPKNVQEMLALGFPCFVVNSVEQTEVKGHKVVYKVVLSDPENFETVLYITEKGQVLE